jgi:hypothetical protein
MKAVVHEQQIVRTGVTVADEDLWLQALNAALHHPVEEQSALETLDRPAPDLAQFTSDFREP